MLVVVSLSGFVTDIDGPFAGTTYDSKLLVESRIKPEKTIIGDGHFSADLVTLPIHHSNQSCYTGKIDIRRAQVSASD